jgi:MoCo/4Fe-4S cofactor protein with predicted Tat translocation signal
MSPNHEHHTDHTHSDHEHSNDETPAKASPFWTDLDQYNQDPEFMAKAESEFMSSPLKEGDAEDGVARRDFLKLMGASIAMATAGCVRPVQHIIPYAQAPKEVTPGEINLYASTWFDGSQGYGLLVRTLEGRPIKLEGNPEHPMNKGALPARAHAEVLSLYDPDRLRGPRRNLQNKARTNFEVVDAKWEEIDTAVLAQLAKGKVAILSASLPSPSSQALIADFFKAFSGQHVSYDVLSKSDVREAARRCYGKDSLPRYRFEKAKMVVSIDGDFLGTYVSPVEFTKAFTKARRPGADMARLVSFESLLSLTGMNADDRFRIRPSEQLDVVLGLIYEVGQLSGHSLPGKDFLKSYSSVSQKLGLDEKIWKQIASELWRNRGQGIVIAGGLPTQTEEGVELQIAVNTLNSILENDGKTIDYDNSPYASYSGSTADLHRLITDMSSGKVSTLIIHGFNPVYTLPRSSGFREAASKVPMILYTGNTTDETSRIAHYIIPGGSSLENWGDFELQRGLFSIQQPTIRPMYQTRSFEESLHAWASKAGSVPARVKAAVSWFDYVRANWKSEVFPHASGGKSFDDFWVSVLQDGVVDTAAGKRDSNSGSRNVAGDALKARSKVARMDGYELVIYEKVHMGDGRFANVAWMQELPDPVTKIVWDNYLSISPAAAKKEGLKEGQIVQLKVLESTIEVPVHIQPGQHDSTLGLAVGYGQMGTGKIASGLGHNAYALAAYNNGRTVFSGLAASIQKTAEKYDLVSTQSHHQLHGRHIVAETRKAEFLKDPSSGIEKSKVFSIWPEHKYTQHKWAMSIDMSSCTGCSACVIACQSENNVPVVGKRYVMEGREMHWIRIDRYYRGEPENPDVVFQPMLCQHCENAPCETVCPVLATVHNDEGLNDMIYNRCVGTRYCSNNCPYKVRRFNWFNYSKREGFRRDPLFMALNPDVTVRSRGVMEKCSFCVQRIRKGTNEARDLKQKLRDGAIKTACEETCPADAITFGDLNDPESRVAKLFANERGYGVLEDLNTRPRIRYLSRVRNTDRPLLMDEEEVEEKREESEAEEKALAAKEHAATGEKNGSAKAHMEGERK